MLEIILLGHYFYGLVQDYSISIVKRTGDTAVLH